MPEGAKKESQLCVVAVKQKHDQTPMLKLYEWAHGKFPNYVDCRSIFGREMLDEAGFRILDATELNSWRLPIEVVGENVKNTRLKQPAEERIWKD